MEEDQERVIARQFLTVLCQRIESNDLVLTLIDLRNSPIGNAGLKMLTRAIENHPDIVTEVVLDGTGVSGAVIEAFLISLGDNSTLRRISLQNTNCQGIRIGKLLNRLYQGEPQTFGLQSLNLKSANLTEAELIEIAVYVLSSNPPLKSIELNFLEIPGEMQRPYLFMEYLWNSLRSNTKLEELQLEGLEDNDFVSLERGLRVRVGNINLKKINFELNCGHPDSAVTLARFFEHSSSLTEVIIRAHHLNDVSIGRILRALSRIPTLEVVELSCAHAGTQSLLVFSDLLVAGHNLKRVNFFGSDQITLDSLNRFARSLLGASRELVMVFFTPPDIALVPEPQRAVMSGVLNEIEFLARYRTIWILPFVRNLVNSLFQGLRETNTEGVGEDIREALAERTIQPFIAALLQIFPANLRTELANTRQFLMDQIPVAIRCAEEMIVRNIAISPSRNHQVRGDFVEFFMNYFMRIYGTARAIADGDARPNVNGFWEEAGMAVREAQRHQTSLLGQEGELLARALTQGVITWRENSTQQQCQLLMRLGENQQVNILANEFGQRVYERFSVQLGCLSAENLQAFGRCVVLRMINYFKTRQTGWWDIFIARQNRAPGEEFLDALMQGMSSEMIENAPLVTRPVEELRGWNDDGAGLDLHNWTPRGILMETGLVVVNGVNNPNIVNRHYYLHPPETNVRRYGFCLSTPEEVRARRFLLPAEVQEQRNCFVM